MDCQLGTRGGVLDQDDYLLIHKGSGRLDGQFYTTLAPVHCDLHTQILTDCREWTEYRRNRAAITVRYLKIKKIIVTNRTWMDEWMDRFTFASVLFKHVAPPEQ